MSPQTCPFRAAWLQGRAPQVSEAAATSSNSRMRGYITHIDRQISALPKSYFQLFVTMPLCHTLMRAPTMTSNIMSLKFCLEMGRVWRYTVFLKLKDFSQMNSAFTIPVMRGQLSAKVSLYQDKTVTVRGIVVMSVCLVMSGRKIEQNVFWPSLFSWYMAIRN